jgi:hypothetical protein
MSILDSVTSEQGEYRYNHSANINGNIFIRREITNLVKMLFFIQW